MTSHAVLRSNHVTLNLITVAKLCAPFWTGTCPRWRRETLKQVRLNERAMHFQH